MPSFEGKEKMLLVVIFSLISSTLVMANSDSGFTSDFTSGTVAGDDQYPWSARPLRESAPDDPEKSLERKWTAATNDPSDLHGPIHHQFHQSLSEKSGQLSSVKNEKQRQLPSLRVDPDKDYSYIQSKNPLVSRITPISLVDLDYYSDEEELYEEMDQLLQLRRMSNDNANTQSVGKVNRGDMDPMISSPVTTIIDRKISPIRGDIVRRNKRSYQDDHLWGFAEDEGIVSSGESSADMHQPSNQLETRNKPDYQRQLDQENKLLDYIARNRPIIVGHQGNSRRRVQQSGAKSISNSRQQASRSRESNHVEEEEDPINKPHLMEQKHRDLSTINLENRSNRDEVAKLENIPVSARIIIMRDSSREKPTVTITSPPFLSRGNFDNDIEFPALNPDRQGLEAPRFPVAPTPRPPSTPPSACVWAVLQCCPTSADYRRLTRCFEYMGCPGINWDPSPCRTAIADAARAEVVRYYASNHRSQ